MFRKEDPKHTCAVIFAAFYQALLDSPSIPDRIISVFVSYGINSLGAPSGEQTKKPGEADIEVEKYAGLLDDWKLKGEYEAARLRGLRLAACADSFERDTSIDIRDEKLFVSWMARYGAYTAINWTKHSVDKKDSAIRKQNEILLTLHKDLRKLLPLTFNHVVMVMAELARKN